jgi:hypothetical protein
MGSPIESRFLISLLQQTEASPYRTNCKCSIIGGKALNVPTTEWWGAIASILVVISELIRFFKGG